MLENLRLCVGYAIATLIAARDRGGTTQVGNCVRELLPSSSQALPSQPPWLANLLVETSTPSIDPGPRRARSARSECVKTHGYETKVLIDRLTTQVS
jgi:hypothetical protein